MKVPKWLGISATVVALIIVVALFAATSDSASSAVVASQAPAAVVSAPSEEQAPNNVQVSVAVQQQPIAVAPPARPANQHRIGSLLITVNSVRVLEGKIPSYYGKPQPYLQYVVLELNVQNIGSSIYDLRFEKEFKLVDNEFVSYGSGNVFSNEYGTLGIPSPSTYSYGTRSCQGCLEAGKETGTVLLPFKMLKGTKSAFLDYTSKYGDASGRIPLAQ